MIGLVNVFLLILEVYGMTKSTPSTLDNPLVDYYVSLIITGVIFLIQIILFFQTWKALDSYGKMLPNSILNADNVRVNEEDIRLINIEKSLYSQIFSKLVDDLNSYFLKNKGVVDFEIIKSIIERQVDSEEELASSRISSPIYVGLMGTVLGIVLGMYSIANQTLEDSTKFSDVINSLIGGVAIAMIATFFGILFTMLSNFYIYRNAKSQVERNRNNFLTFIQTELLPHLQSSLHQTLNVLGKNVEKFNKTFKSNIDAFDTKFKESIESLKTSVSSLNDGMGKIVENTKMQQNFIDELREIHFQNLAKSNKDLLARLIKTTPILNSFITEQEKLNKTIQDTDRFVQKVSDLLDRISTFEESVNRLGQNINTNEFLGNEVLIRIDKNLKYLDQQSELLIQHSNDSTSGLKEHFKAELEKIQRLTQTIQSEIEKALDFNIDRNPLMKLSNLDDIKGSLESLNGLFSTNGESTSEIAMAIKSLNSLVSTYKQIADELVAISTSIKNIDSKALTSHSLEEVIKRHKNGEAENKGWWPFK